MHFMAVEAAAQTILHNPVEENAPKVPTARAPLEEDNAE